MKKTIFLLFVISLLFLNSCFNQNKTCIIRGRVFAPNCKSVFLFKIQEDISEQGLEIPVKDSLINYQIKIENPEGYNLFLQKGGGRAMPIFLEASEINLTIYGENEFDKNEIHGGKLNKQYAQYKISRENFIDNEIKPSYMSLRDSLDLLKNTDNYYSDSMKTINNLIEITTDREEKRKLKKIGWALQESNLYYSKAAQSLVKKQKDLSNEASDWEFEYYKENPSIVSYFFLLNNIYYSSGINEVKTKEALKVLIQNNPNHPYTDHARIWLQKENNIKIGGKYIDFVAPDLSGKQVRLSDSIKGKYAIINLWSTTCGPCIRHSREMMSVYNDYKKFGFTIVGVSGEFHNTENLKKRLDIEKFPWLNLVELDRQNRIWDKYGISFSGGRMFLVDKEGIILAIEPSAEEVKNILEEKLN